VPVSTVRRSRDAGWFDYRRVNVPALQGMLKRGAWEAIQVIFPGVAGADLAFEGGDDTLVVWPEEPPVVASAFFKRQYARFLRLSAEPWVFQGTTPSPIEVAAVAVARAAKRRWFRSFTRRTERVEPIEFHRFHQAITATAFADASFRLSVARYLQRMLTERVITYPDAPPRIVLSDATLLTLLVMHQRSTPVEYEAFGRSVTALHRQVTAAQGWAGFWDQFILAEAVEYHRRSLESVRELPLVRDGAQALTLDPAGDAPAAKPGWRSEAPSYGARLLAGLP
jgi:hypothetical protein